MSSLTQDLRHGFKALRDHPGLTAIAVLSLALGIAPNTAVFSLIDAVGFRPLPIPDASRLVGVYTSHREDRLASTSFPDFADIRERVGAFATVAASSDNAVGISGDGRPPAVEMAATVTGNYFATLGLRPRLGRLISGADDEGNGAPVVVISHRLWVSRYEADAHVVGRTIRLNNTDCTVIGVAPEGFAGTRPVLAPDVWTPVALGSTLVPGRAVGLRQLRDERSYDVFARLREGATLQQARTELESLGRSLATSYPETNAGRQLTADFEQTVRRRLPAAAGAAALGVIGLILLTACANVAGLLLGRGEARRTEIAVRLALGAGRGRIVRQLLVEGLVLALVAGAASLLVAFWLVRLIPGLVPALPVTVNLDLRLDPRVLAFTLLVALVTVPVFALAPALVASRTDLTPVLKGEAVRAGRWRWLTLRNALVVAQIAISLVLLVSSGIMARSLIASRAIDPGFVQRPMLFATMAPQVIGYSRDQVREFYDRLSDRLSAIPGVERVTLARHVPLNSLYGGGATKQVEIPGYQLPPGQTALRVRNNVVGAGFLATMGTRVARGREFTPSDTAASQPVVLVNQKMATDYWSGEDPVGRRLWLVSDTGARTEAAVVGVVQNAKYNSLNESLQPYLYLPYAQHPAGEMTVIVRVSGDERAMVAPFRRAIEALDPAMPTLQIVTFTEHLRMALFAERAAATAAAVLGGLGLFLSVIGLHGVVAYLVARRTREIGIRMALGAGPGDVRAHVLGQGGRLVAAGLAIGLALSLFAARVIAGSVYGVSPLDPVALGGALAVVTLVALSATWIPARRASRLDPVVALRQN